MKTWYVIEIEEAWLLGGTFHRLCRQFQHAYMAAGSPSDMALFAGHDVSNDGRRVFLTPASATHVTDLIESYQACPCEAPSPDHLTLLYGPSDAKNYCWTTNGTSGASMAP